MSRFLPLEQALEKAGWSVNRLPLASDCWWAKEIWQLTSLWSPTGTRLHLSLLLDPQGGFDPNLPPDSAVWAAHLSQGVPVTRPLEGILIRKTLAKGIKEVVVSAAEMRRPS